MGWPRTPCARPTAWAPGPSSSRGFGSTCRPPQLPRGRPQPPLCGRRLPPELRPRRQLPEAQVHSTAGWWKRPLEWRKTVHVGVWTSPTPQRAPIHLSQDRYLQHAASMVMKGPLARRREPHMWWLGLCPTTTYADCSLEPRLLHHASRPSPGTSRLGRASWQRGLLSGMLG